MLTTTEFRSHWIDSAGRCYAQRHPYRASQLQPVINLAEVIAWVALATSDDMRRIGFPGDDARVSYARQFLRADIHEAERERLAALLCEELTDDVPRYSQHQADWRSPFVAMRERWPLPVLGGPCEIHNLTPHAVVVHEITFAPSGVIARATEEATAATPILMLVPDPGTALDPVGRRGTYAAPNEAVVEIPTSTTRYTGLVDLPDPAPGVYLIVSLVVAQVAAERGRWTGDLLTPGQQVRDAAGRIIGCKSLCCAPDIEPAAGWEQRAVDRAKREGVLPRT